MRLRFFKTKLLMIDQDYWETASPSQGFDEKRISRSEEARVSRLSRHVHDAALCAVPDAQIRDHLIACRRPRGPSVDNRGVLTPVG